ncbi:L-rhamnose mutarotase [Gelidibacter salicanalis]|uniref:L-rhamnose mutarotase n=1 Tax=Gelidibacter salicanalis TaxID=291193 RepID=A0A5C7AXL7_9FLAO|nr:L-rhamnose mutarotase [Gelidibacter salicanalis]TXE10482.1 L-rhamnose mutarotase [Gelidibacter salicanalis]
MKTHRHCFALDLINDDELISAYKKHHENVWPEIVESITDSGILNLEIYLVENRLFMIMDVNYSFSFDKKNENDANNPTVQEWESLMWKYQQALPTAKEDEKWLLMEKIYHLKA